MTPEFNKIVSKSEIPVTENGGINVDNTACILKEKKDEPVPKAEKGGMY